MKKPIILIGAGGHCRSCIDVIENTEVYKIAGIIDVKENIGNSVYGYQIIGSDENIPEYCKDYKNVLITVGQIKSPDKRIALFKMAQKYNAVFPYVVSTFSHVSVHSKIGNGSIIMHNCFVNAGVEIGKINIINTGAIIEHDVIINDNCHISTGCIINGGCRIGKNVFLGSKTVVINNIDICDNVIVGSGSLVIKNIYDSGVYFGTPARKIK